MVRGRIALFQILSGLAAPWAVVSAVGLVACGQQQSSTSKHVPGPEEKAYVQEIAVTDARMSAAQNFLGDTVTYVDVSVTNKGKRQVRQLEIQLEFHDMLGQVVLRQKAHPVSSRTAPLRPSETRSFRISLEHLPAEWDRTPPHIIVADVSF